MMRAEMLLRLLVATALLACTVAYLVVARSFQPLAGYVPLLAGSAACAVLTLIVLREIFRLVRHAAGHRVQRLQTVEGEAEVDISRAVGIASVKYIAYMLVLLVFVRLVGLLIAGPIFAAVFLWLDSKVDWRVAVAVGAGTFASFWVLRHYLGFALP